MSQEVVGRKRIAVNRERLAQFCRKHRIRELSFFGSVLRDDFGLDSDVDVLVEFDPQATVTLLDHVQIQRELSELLGRDVDLVTKRSLSPVLRDEILTSRELIYEPGYSRTSLYPGGHPAQRA